MCQIINGYHRICLHQVHSQTQECPYRIPNIQCRGVTYIDKRIEGEDHCPWCIEIFRQSKLLEANGRAINETLRILYNRRAQLAIEKAQWDMLRCEYERHRQAEWASLRPGSTNILQLSLEQQAIWEAQRAKMQKDREYFLFHRHHICNEIRMWEAKREDWVRRTLRWDEEKQRFQAQRSVRAYLLGEGNTADSSSNSDGDVRMENSGDTSGEPSNEGFPGIFRAQNSGSSSSSGNTSAPAGFSRDAGVPNFFGRPSNPGPSNNVSFQTNFGRPSNPGPLNNLGFQTNFVRSSNPVQPNNPGRRNDSRRRNNSGHSNNMNSSTKSNRQNNSLPSNHPGRQNNSRFSNNSNSQNNSNNSGPRKTMKKHNRNKKNLRI